MHYYKFNIADWVKDTAHLSLKEEAILLRLINYYVNTEKFIPLKTHMVLRKLRIADEMESVEILLEEFFVRDSDGWKNKELDKVISEYQKRADRNRENGRSGGRPKNKDLDKPTGLQDGKQVDIELEPNGNLNYKPLTTNQESVTKNDKKEIRQQQFDIFWDSYNKKTDRTKCRSKFEKMTDLDVKEILSSVGKYVQSTPDVKFRKNPSTWLNGRCWEDELVSQDSNNYEVPAFMRGVR